MDRWNDSVPLVAIADPSRRRLGQRAGRDRPSTVSFLIAGVAIALPAIQTLGWTEVQTDSGRFPVVVGPGYYLWLTALFAQSMWLISRGLSWGADDTGYRQ